jgi:hypothetical protein
VLLMAAGEFRLHQAVVQLATTLEQIRVICDRAHEEQILLARDERTIDLACHYAVTVGTVMTVAQQELERLQSELGIRRAAHHEEADARARASLEAFRRSVQLLEEGSRERSHLAG